MAVEAPEPPQPLGWDEGKWDSLIGAITAKPDYAPWTYCTPFIGAGACAPFLPLGGQLAREWAATPIKSKDNTYPFDNDSDLIRVAQWVSVEANSIEPRQRLEKRFAQCPGPDFNDQDGLHRLLADLKLPLYITTNYDDYMLEALKHVFKGTTAQPSRAVCQWRAGRRRQGDQPQAPITPSREAPVVYHLHGALKAPDPIVLTEDDYIEFLLRMSDSSDPIIPKAVLDAFASTRLLFLGYSLEDINLKILLRGFSQQLLRGGGPIHLSVQLPPSPSTKAGAPPTQADVDRAKRQRDHMLKHFNLREIDIYWGTCQQFARDLRKRLT